MIISSCHKGRHSPCAAASHAAERKPSTAITLATQLWLFHVQLLPAQTAGAAAPAEEPGRQLAEREHLRLCQREGGI